MAAQVRPRPLVSGVALRRTLSWLHIGGLIGSWGGLVFILISLLPAQGALPPRNGVS
jgi:hypothetical protein